MKPLSRPHARSGLLNLSFVFGHVWEKEKRSPFVSVPRRCRHTTRRSQRPNAARPSWENHCVMGFCCTVFIRTAFSDTFHCVGGFLLFVFFCMSMTRHKRTDKNKPLFFGFKIPICVSCHWRFLFYHRFACKYYKKRLPTFKEQRVNIWSEQLPRRLVSSWDVDQLQASEPAVVLL